MPVRKLKKRLESSHYTKIISIEPECAPLSLRTHVKKQKRTNSELETNIILATILLMCLGLILYFVVMFNLGSSANSSPASQPVLVGSQGNLKDGKSMKIEQK